MILLYWFVGIWGVGAIVAFILCFQNYDWIVAKLINEDFGDFEATQDEKETVIQIMIVLFCVFAWPLMIKAVVS